MNSVVHVFSTGNNLICYDNFVFCQLGGNSEPIQILVIWGLINQIIASAEYMNNAIHSAVRGGVSNGYTNPASRTKSGLTSVVSVYPFLADDEITRRLRDGSFGSIRERNEVIAMLLVHELGHQLLGLGHPFENTACVMNPPRLLHFKDWLKMQNPKECEIGSSSDMKIGRFTFLDLRKRESQ